MNATERAYRFFRAHELGARYAIRLARAELRAEDMGLTVTAEPEVESYRDVYGEDPPKGIEFYCLMVRAPDGDVLASLGFVDDYDRACGWCRIQSADLLDDALTTIDARQAEKDAREASMLRAIDSAAATL